MSGIVKKVIMATAGQGGIDAWWALLNENIIASPEYLRSREVLVGSMDQVYVNAEHGDLNNDTQGVLYKISEAGEAEVVKRVDDQNNNNEANADRMAFDTLNSRLVFTGGVSPSDNIYGKTTDGLSLIDLTNTSSEEDNSAESDGRIFALSDGSVLSARRRSGGNGFVITRINSSYTSYDFGFDFIKSASDTFDVNDTVACGDPSGNYWVGTQNNRTGDIYLLHFDEDGTQISGSLDIRNNSDNLNFGNLIVDSSDNVYVFTQVGSSHRLLKINSLGNIVWHVEISAVSSGTPIMEFDSEGNIVLLGLGTNFNSKHVRFVRVSLSDGSIIGGAYHDTTLPSRAFITTTRAGKVNSKNLIVFTAYHSDTKNYVVQRPLDGSLDGTYSDLTMSSSAFSSVDRSSENGNFQIYSLSITRSESYPLVKDNNIPSFFSLPPSNAYSSFESIG